MQITLKDILLVGTGGFAGSVCRFLISVSMAPASAAAGFPVGTLGVNMAGSLLIGIIISMAGSAPLTLLAATGFCGGFTTFSAFSAETLAMVRGGQPWTAAGYALISVAACLVMVSAGMYLTAKLKS